MAFGFLAGIFGKDPEALTRKGDRALEEGQFYEARTRFQEALELYGRSDSAPPDAPALLAEKVRRAERGLAELNLAEAEHALERSQPGKAEEHLQLAKTLTDDPQLREKADKLLGRLHREEPAGQAAPPPSAGCSTCRTTQPAAEAAGDFPGCDLPVADHYDLLIRQLPGELYGRYAELGEKFAYAYLASAEDDHRTALRLLDDWYDGSHQDIYCYEKGMILHRLGDTAGAEASLRTSLAQNPHNPLSHLGLALLLIECGRIDEAAVRLDGMIAEGIQRENAMLLRGDLARHAGDGEGALQLYAQLLDTPLVRQGAERLHGVLLEAGRTDEAQAVFKRYLKGCAGH